MTMQRLLLLLVMLAFGLTQAAAAPMAVCQHSDADAHAAALESDDAETAAAASHEEDAASAAGKRGVPTDAGGSAIGSIILPTGPAVPAAGEPAGAPRRPSEVLLPSGRVIAPLLDPPLA
jgi:hypothetical protein